MAPNGKLLKATKSSIWLPARSDVCEQAVDFVLSIFLLSRVVVVAPEQSRASKQAKPQPVVSTLEASPTDGQSSRRGELNDSTMVLKRLSAGFPFYTIAQVSLEPTRRKRLVGSTCCVPLSALSAIKRARRKIAKRFGLSEVEDNDTCRSRV